MSCCICLSPSTKNNFNLKCEHSFCNKCITQWLLINDDCPCCRTKIIESKKSFFKNNYKFSISFEPHLIIQSNLNEPIINRIHDIINVLYYKQHPNYNWNISSSDDDIYVSTKISTHTTIISLEISIYSLYNVEVIHVENITTLLKPNKKEYKLKNKKIKWQCKDVKHTYKKKPNLFTY